MYDSSYFDCDDDTLIVIAQLVRSCKDELEVKFMNVAKQTGSVDCGLFALATITCLALGNDPTTVVFDQKQLRHHLIKSMETNTISSFPVIKTRRPKSKVSKVQTCIIYCVCRQADYGPELIQCNTCKKWFHLGDCFKKPDNDYDDWFCTACTT